MLVAPSWGGMLNGLLTLRGAWDKVRQDPVLKFLVGAVTAYGMATLEGPTLASQKQVNSLSHYTDWTIAHVHTGVAAWMEWVVDFLSPILAHPATLSNQALVNQDGQLPLLDRADGNDVLRHPNVAIHRRHHHRRNDVEAVYPGRLS